MTAEVSHSDLTVEVSVVPEQESHREPLGPYDPPRPRRVPFSFEGPCVPYWMGGSFTGSMLLDAYTLVFPSMEAMMVRHLTKVASKPGSPADQVVMRAFCKQEGSHAHAHRKSVDSVREQGYEVDKALARIDKTFTKVLEGVFKYLVYPVPFLGDKFAVGLIAGIEHWTAVISEAAITPGTFPVTLGSLGGEEVRPLEQIPDMEILYLWHAAEELEHKNVVHEFMTALGGGELNRIASFLFVTPSFFLMTAMCFGSLLRQSKRVLGPGLWPYIGEVGGWRGVYRDYKVSLRPMLKAYRRAVKLYLKKGYHPADLPTDQLVIDAFARLDQLRDIKAA